MFLLQEEKEKGERRKGKWLCLLSHLTIGSVSPFLCFSSRRERRPAKCFPGSLAHCVDYAESSSNCHSLRSPVDREAAASVQLKTQAAFSLFFSPSFSLLSYRPVRCPSSLFLAFLVRLHSDCPFIPLLFRILCVLVCPVSLAIGSDGAVYFRKDNQAWALLHCATWHYSRDSLDLSSFHSPSNLARSRRREEK